MHPPQQRKVRRYLLALVPAVVATCVLSACTAGRSASSAVSSTLIVNTSFVYKTLDPGRAYEQTGYVAVHALYDTLLTFDGGDVTTPKPDLAESFESAPDSRTFTFTLRAGVTFSDGAPLTAKDVVYSLSRLRNLKGSSASFFTGLNATAPDDRTVVVTSETPNPTVPVLLAMPAASIVNSAAVTANGGTDGADAASADKAQSFLDTASAGSGPYVLESNSPGEQIVLKANDHYWGSKPGYSRVVIKNMDAQNQKLTLSRAGDPELALDVAGALLDGLPTTVAVSKQEDTSYFAYLNTDPAVSAVTSNPAFVKALRAALDYQGLAKLFGSAQGPARGLIAPAYPGALPAQDAMKQDLPLARRLLADAGIGNPAVDFIYPAITYRGVDLGTIATKVQGDAAAAGITINLTPLPLSAFLEQYRGGKSAMGMTPQALSYPRAESMVRVMSPDGVNAKRLGWTSAKAPDSVRTATADFLAATSDDARNAAAVRWQHAMTADSPYLLLGANAGTVVSTKAVTGADYTAAGWIVDLAAVRPAG